MGLKLKFISYFLSTLFLFTGCSSTRWVVESQETIDRNDFKLLDSKLFLNRIDRIRPEEPLVRFKLKTANTIEFAERIRTDRYIQTYRPRLGYVLFGLASAGIAGYAAFSNDIVNEQNQTQKIALIGAGTALTGISFLNMKPVGEPTATGESKLLRRTGKRVEVDTLDTSSEFATIPEYEILFNNEVIIPKTKRSFRDNIIEINLAEEIAPESLPENRDININLNIYFQDSTYNYSIPVSSIFESFVVVTSNVSALRNKPEVNRNNVLTDLAKGSQLKLVERQGDWFKALYGISETWVAASDVVTIWRPSEFSHQLSVVAIPNVPFGSIDIERNFPSLVSESKNRWAYMISNGSYTGILSERNYAKRDARLMNEYFNKTLGVPADNILSFEDQHGSQPIRNSFNRLVSGINNSPSELVVYLSGYARVDETSKEIFFLGTVNDTSSQNEVSLNSLFDGIAQLPLTKISVIADLEFINQTKNNDALEDLASLITSNIKESAIVFSADTDQTSLIYSTPNGVQKRHSIFTYFVADAFKNRYSNWGAIVKHLQRNVSFTSRSLYNQPQDIQFFGNLSLDLNY